jgi:hypothetical protein
MLEEAEKLSSGEWRCREKLDGSIGAIDAVPALIKQVLNL